MRVKLEILITWAQSLVVATDRISTYDVVHPNGVPGKGIILTQMTLHALERSKVVLPTHLLTANVDDYPAPFRGVDELRGRSMLVTNLNMVDFEAIVRGYLYGSGWTEYGQTGAVGGLVLPPGLREADSLKFPKFTPSTKAKIGHDQNISFKQMEQELRGVYPYLPNLADQIRAASLAVYGLNYRYAHDRRVIVADTKFEFGLNGEELTLADEVVTPDSSRFWPLDGYKPGGTQPSLDKQFVRDYAASTGWDKKPPAPEFPPEIVAQTQARYLQALEMLHPDSRV